LPAVFGQAFSLNAAGVIGTLGGLAVACAMMLRHFRASKAAPQLISG
jgi:hypothetical protein